MDLGTILGLLFCLLAICLSIMGGVDIAKMNSFIDYPSIGIVLGGTITAIFVSFPTKQLKQFFAIRVAPCPSRLRSGPW